MKVNKLIIASALGLWFGSEAVSGMQGSSVELAARKVQLLSEELPKDDSAWILEFDAGLYKIAEQFGYGESNAGTNEFINDIARVLQQELYAKNPTQQSENN